MPHSAFARKGRHESLAELGRRVHDRGLIAGTEGNLSCRLPGGQILITPAGRAKSEICENDLALLAPDGAVLRGDPSSERSLHVQLYQHCPEAVFAVHAHPPSAVAWSLAHPDADKLPAELLPEALLAFGRVPIAPYARPGSEELARSIRPFLPDCRAIILGRHGALTWGESAEEALALMEQLEQVALILTQAFASGSPRPLPPEEVAAILEARKS